MTQITVEKLFPPQDGAKSGGIRGTDGRVYRVKTASFDRYQVGQTFNVAVKETEFNGKSYFWLPDEFNPGPLSSNSSAPSQAPAPLGHNRPPVASGNVQTKDAAMFVMGVVGRAMGSGKFDTQDIPLLAKAAIAAWNEVKGSL